MPKLPHLAFFDILPAQTGGYGIRPYKFTILTAQTGGYGIRPYKFTILTSNTAGASLRPTNFDFHPTHSSRKIPLMKHRNAGTLVKRYRIQFQNKEVNAGPGAELAL